MCCSEMNIIQVVDKIGVIAAGKKRVAGVVIVAFLQRLFLLSRFAGFSTAASRFVRPGMH